MPRSTPRSYQLTPALLASSVGAGVLCLAGEGLGRSYRLHARRPDAATNRRPVMLGGGAVEWRADLPSGAAHVIAPVAPKPGLIRVDISGPLEQRAGYHGECGGWTDGSDAVAERLCAAFAEGDVLLVGDTPGGAAAGAQQSVAKALAAKLKFGRRCTGFANEEVGSLGMWWMLGVCDELFLPVMGRLGSIGARAAHLDISGAMEKAGEKLTYFADPPDKVALAAEMPLGAVGAMRGNRDVKLIADAFRAACCASPIGLRYGLTPEALIALGADMLTGQAAVDAGLADGVASEDEVTAYALRQAERGASKGTVAKSSGGKARARVETRNMDVRTEGDGEEARARAEDEGPPSSEPGKHGDGDGPESDDMAAGREIPTKCGAPGCGVENEADAKFCKGCGASMATGSAEASSGMPKPAARVSASASLSELLGLSADASLPAQKTALIDLRLVFDTAVRITGKRDADGIVGGLMAVEKDAGRAGQLAKTLADDRRKAEKAERWSLAHKLVKLGTARGTVFVDAVNEDGTRKLDANQKAIVTLTPQYAEMRIGTLRGLVDGLAKNAKPHDPFVPDRAAAEQASRAAAEAPKMGEPTPAQIEIAKKDPVVLAIVKRSGNTMKLEDVAKNHARVQLAMSAGGAQ